MSDSRIETLLEALLNGTDPPQKPMSRVETYLYALILKNIGNSERQSALEEEVNKLSKLLDSSDTNLDQLSEIVTFIKENRSLLEMATEHADDSVKHITREEREAWNAFKGVTDGEDGEDGADGVSIVSVEQTTTSTEDGGINVITVTLSDNKTSTFKIQNGTKGTSGKDGEDGYTPTKGIDYFTEEDKNEIIEAVVAQLSATTE